MTDVVEQLGSLSCKQACSELGVQVGEGGSIQLPFRQGRCPHGLSRLQIGILSLIKSRPGVIAYWQIAKVLESHLGVEVTDSAVRGAVHRMPRHAFLLRSRARTLSHSGNLYTLRADPCPYITPLVESEQSPVQVDNQAVSCSGPSLIKIERETPSISQDESSSKLLALSESDISFHWPRLAQSGFGVSQIERIVSQLNKIGKTTINVLQGLHHAEWELEHGAMLDKNKQPVAAPVDWIFVSLAKNGSYRRPQGYVSSEEQTAIDATEESNRRLAALEAWLTREFELWRNMLSSEQVEDVLPNPKPSEPVVRESLLRSHFRKHLWPEILAAKSPHQLSPVDHGATSETEQRPCTLESREDARETLGE